MNSLKATAIFYQANPPPMFGRARKPMKPGGYADSGADIGFALSEHGVRVVAPTAKPDPAVDRDWVFPDTPEGFAEAYAKGARCFWLNTVLYSGHPMEQWMGRDLRFVGQLPECVDVADDKYATNGRLRAAGLSVASSVLIGSGSTGLVFPGVVKPVRGRGSQGVAVIASAAELREALQGLIASGEYGSEFIWEEMLPGQEITITVMPPGDGRGYWALPPVERFNHAQGIAPYSGKVAVVTNSRVLEPDKNLLRVMQECEQAAGMVGARAPVRIDCRQDAAGVFRLFDVNLKPNITGPGRPGRADQTSLMGMAAAALGWSYGDFLLRVLALSW